MKHYPISAVVADARSRPITSDYAFGERSGGYQISKMNIKDFPNGRLISHVTLSPEALAAAGLLLEAGKLMNERMDAFTALIPPGCSHQFYGKWDCIVVREPRDEPTE
jgi:hypothetical protein